MAAGRESSRTSKAAFANAGLFDPSLGRKVETPGEQVARSGTFVHGPPGLRGFQAFRHAFGTGCGMARCGSAVFPPLENYFGTGFAAPGCITAWARSGGEPERARYDHYLRRPSWARRAALSGKRLHRSGVGGEAAERPRRRSVHHESGRASSRGWQCRREARQDLRGAAKAAAPEEARVTLEPSGPAEQPAAPERPCP